VPEQLDRRVGHERGWDDELSKRLGVFGYVSISDDAISVVRITLDCGITEPPGVADIRLQILSDYSMNR